MTEQLRRNITERHGAELGGVLYEAELSRRARITERVSGLQAQLDEALAEYERQSTALARNMAPFDAAMQLTYDRWVAACNAREAQRVRNQAATSPIEARIAELRTGLTTPEFDARVQQWGTPDWHKPVAELPPMPRA